MTGFEPATAWTTIKRLPGEPFLDSALSAALRPSRSVPPNLDMRGYSAIVGVFRQ
jgi:hypothetical protein